MKFGKIGTGKEKDMSSKKKRSAPSKEPEGPRPKRAKKGESSKTSEPKVIPRNSLSYYEGLDGGGGGSGIHYSLKI